MTEPINEQEKPRELGGLDALAGQAAAVDAAAFEQNNPQPEQTENEGGQDAPPLSDALVMTAMPEAAMIAGVACDFVEKKYGVELSKETRATGAQKIAPLLVKYDVDSPFVRKWKLEIDALVFIAATGYGVWMARRGIEAGADKAGHVER